jgi:hypothetical protein
LAEKDRPSISLKPFLNSNWSQEPKHLRLIVLGGRKFLPMKAGTTGYAVS